MTIPTEGREIMVALNCAVAEARTLLGRLENRLMKAEAERDELLTACKAAVSIMESYEFTDTIPHELCVAALAKAKEAK